MKTKKQRPCKKLVLTGGPSGGKTALAYTLLRQFPKQIAIVPEAASLLFSGGFPRSQTTQEQCHQQMAIYHVQKNLEAIIELRNPKKLIVCDRGSLDGLAYWPKTPSSSFFKAIGSTMSEEIKRYRWVIHLDTAPQNGYAHNNPYRKEDFHEADQINKRIKKAWGQHPRQYIIENHQQFARKLELAIELVQELLKS